MESPRFQREFTGGVFRMVRTLSHSDCWRRDGIADILSRDVVRSVIRAVLSSALAG